MANNPWDDPSLANEETKKLKKRTERLRMEGPQPAGKPKTAPGISALSDAYGQAEKLARRNRKIEKATRPLRKALPGQEE